MILSACVGRNVKQRLSKILSNLNYDKTYRIRILTAHASISVHQHHFRTTCAQAHVLSDQRYVLSPEWLASSSMILEHYPWIGNTLSVLHQDLNMPTAAVHVLPFEMCAS